MFISTARRYKSAQCRLNPYIKHNMMGLGWLNVKPCMYVRILWAMASAGGGGSQPNQPDVSLVEAVLEPGGRVGKPTLVVWDIGIGRGGPQPTITGWCPASCLLPGFNSWNMQCARMRLVRVVELFCRISPPLEQEFAIFVVLLNQIFQCQLCFVCFYTITTTPVGCPAWPSHTW